MRKILFVCVHNAGRSQIAEALFNRLAEARGLPYRAISAGTMPTDAINPVVVQVMEEIGISMAGCRPQRLTPEMAGSAFRSITMGCGVNSGACPATFLAGEDWGLMDPAEQPIETVRQIRDEIQRRVELLAQSLASNV